MICIRYNSFVLASIMIIYLTPHAKANTSYRNWINSKNGEKFSLYEKDLNFDLFENNKKSGSANSKASNAPTPLSKDEIELQERAVKRHEMLQTHQKLGLSTWVLMAITTIVGELNYEDMYGANRTGTGRFMGMHHAFALVTMGMFVTTGLYALTAPSGYAKKSGWDRVDWHRMWIMGAALGMVTQYVTGTALHQYAGQGNASALDNLASIHRASGYFSMFCLTSAAAVWVF